VSSGGSPAQVRRKESWPGGPGVGLLIEAGEHQKNTFTAWPDSGDQAEGGRLKKTLKTKMNE
jgi:hypothetical protein